MKTMGSLLLVLVSALFVGCVSTNAEPETVSAPAVSSGPTVGDRLLQEAREHPRSNADVAALFNGGPSSGCSPVVSRKAWTIDSHPQGLRVTVNNIEWGKTPCRLSEDDFAMVCRIAVYPPSEEMLEAYQEKSGKIVSVYGTGRQWKQLSFLAPEGRMLFDFIDREYTRPKDEAGWERLRKKLDRDSEWLEEQKRTAKSEDDK